VSKLLSAVLGATQPAGAHSLCSSNCSGKPVPAQAITFTTTAPKLAAADGVNVTIPSLPE